MKFRVTVRTSEGGETNTLEAENRFEVYSQVEKGGGQVVTLEETAPLSHCPSGSISNSAAA
jgi:hypothetical protein